MTHLLLTYMSKSAETESVLVQKMGKLTAAVLLYSTRAGNSATKCELLLRSSVLSASELGLYELQEGTRQRYCDSDTG